MCSLNYVPHGMCPRVHAWTLAPAAAGGALMETVDTVGSGAPLKVVGQGVGPLIIPIP